MSKEILQYSVEYTIPACIAARLGAIALDGKLTDPTITVTDYVILPRSAVMHLTCDTCGNSAKVTKPRFGKWQIAPFDTRNVVIHEIGQQDTCPAA